MKLRCNIRLRIGRSALIFASLVCGLGLFSMTCVSSAATADPQNPPSSAAPGKAPSAKSATPPNQNPEEELQRTIETAGGDRAALVRNLEAFLKKYPETQARPQIYRTLVEADLQLQDNVHATEYAERIVALSPDDMSMTLLAVQLLERNGDAAALKRATTYVTHVLEYVRQD